MCIDDSFSTSLSSSIHQALSIRVSCSVLITMSDCLICNGTYTVGKVLIMSKTGIENIYPKLCDNHKEMIDAGLEAQAWFLEV